MKTKDELFCEVLVLKKELAEKLSITEIVEKLLGNIEPHGESYYDDECLDNLEKYDRLLFKLILEIQDVSNYHTSFRYSEKECGEKALKILTDIVEMITEKEILAESLEKNKAKKPYLEGELVYDTAICPNCGRHFEFEYEEHYKYCPECGQKLDWSDVDETICNCEKE